ncbi:MAG: hypothetical protein U0T77_10790 [Chitinophagales bacterium]
MNVKKTKPINTKSNKQQEEQMNIQKAQELLQRDKLTREQDFYRELILLCQKFQVDIIPGINIQAK